MQSDGSQLTLPLYEPAKFFTEVDALLVLNHEGAFKVPKKRRLRKRRKLEALE
jgi:hypothetical protein